MLTPDLGRLRRGAALPLAFCLGALGGTGCASVPSETVELSMAVGDDLRELHAGYRSAVALHFGELRRRGLAVIGDEWVPAYLDSFVDGGDLRGIVAAEDWDDLRAWARAAIGDIDARRTEFVESLNARETAMLAMIDDAFARTMNANAHVTAYLQSLVRADAARSRILQATGLGGLRDGIAAGLAEASRFVAEATGTEGAGDPPEREGRR